MGPEQAVQQLTQLLADPVIPPGERQRLRVLRVIAALIGDPDGEHGAFVDEVVDDWTSDSSGGSSTIELDLPGQGGTFGPLTLDAQDSGENRIDVVVSPGDLPIAVSVGVVVRNGQIRLDTSRVPESLPGVDLMPLHAKAHRLIAAHNRRRGGLRRLPDGMAAVEADVRTVIAELEAAGKPVTAGAIRAVYGGATGWDPETDSLDPEMEEVFRRMNLPGAHPPPEPLPVLGAVASERDPIPAELPLVPWTPGTMAIEDRPQVELSYSGPAPDGRWAITITRRDEQPVTLEIDPAYTQIGSRGTQLDLHAVRGLLRTQGIDVEPTSRWFAASSLDAQLDGSQDQEPPWEQARYVDARPMVAVRPILHSEGPGRRLEWRGWTMRVETGDPSTSFEQTVDGRHINDDLLNRASLSEELLLLGIIIDGRPGYLVPPVERLGRRYRRIYPEIRWIVLPSARNLFEPGKGVTSTDEPDQAPAPAGDVDRTKWFEQFLRSRNGKIVVGGAGGMLLLSFLVPQLLRDSGISADPTTTTVFADSGPIAEASSTVAPTGTIADETAGQPTMGVEPPAGYVPPALSFAPEGPPARVADRGSLWGTNTWDTVTSVGKRIGDVESTPPATVYPPGTSFEAEFVIDAECDDSGACTFSIPRGTTSKGEQAHVPLTLDGLTLTGPGDELIEGCTGESGVEFVISDLTVVGSRLVPTYMTGRRWFREDCTSYTRAIENVYNAHYVDRPSLTPTS